MNKKFNVIKVENYGVVVDKYADIIANVTPVINTVAPWYIGEPCRVSLSKSSPFDPTGKVNLFQGIHKIIATIEKRLDGVPLIELTDNIEQLANILC